MIADILSLLFFYDVYLLQTVFKVLKCDLIFFFLVLSDTFTLSNKSEIHILARKIVNH